MGRQARPGVAPVPSVAVVVGNPRPTSRTLALGVEVARVLAAEVGGRVGEIVDLAEHAAHVFDPEYAPLELARARVQEADVVVFVSPTYKAAYTGLLKGFLDSLAHRSLAGHCAVAVMTGGAPQHALAPELLLRPVLVELGACTPASALFVDLESEQSPEDQVAAWAGRSLVELRSVVMTGARTGADAE